MWYDSSTTLYLDETELDGTNYTSLIFSDVFSDLELASSITQGDAELSTLLECLRLSRGAIEGDPKQLPGQILGRISEVKYAFNRNNSIVLLASNIMN